MLRLNVRVEEKEIKEERLKGVERKPLMEFLKRVTKCDPFWAGLEFSCNQSLAGFFASESGGSEADYERFKTLLGEAARNSLKMRKPVDMRLTARLKSTPGFLDLRRKKNLLFRAIRGSLIRSVGESSSRRRRW